MVCSTDPRQFREGEHCLLFLEREGNYYQLNKDRHGKVMIRDATASLDFLHREPIPVEDCIRYIRYLNNCTPIKVW